MTDKHRVQVHRCKKINVALHYVDTQEVRHEFAPKATVNHVKLWYMAELKMSPVHASEHVLQITGITDRPDPDAQIGALVSCCDLASR